MSLDTPQYRIPEVFIDHLAHPHILDLIIGFASVPTLVKLRLTCKSMHRRVDARLLANAQLYVFDDTPKRGGGIGLAIPLDSPLSSNAEVTRVPWAPHAVKTLDVVSPFELPAGGSQPAAQFTSLHTVRKYHLRRTGPYRFNHRPISAHTQVNYISMPQVEQSDPAIPRRLQGQRLVLHVKYVIDTDDRSDVSVNTGDEDDLSSVRDFVIVFWPRPDGIDASDDKGWQFTFLLRLFQYTKRATDFTLTVVGLIPEGGWDAYDTPAAGIANLRQQFQEYLYFMQSWRGQVGIALADALLAALRILSFDEWWAQLGDQRAVEGEWIEPRMPVNRDSEAEDEWVVRDRRMRESYIEHMRLEEERYWQQSVEDDEM